MGNDIKLPKLPDPGVTERRTAMGPHDVYDVPIGYTADQMRDYALAAIAMHRGGAIVEEFNARIAREKNKTRRWALICFRDDIIADANKEPTHDR